MTGFARYCLNFAIELAKEIFVIERPLFADTDSLAIQYDGSDVKQKFNQLNNRLMTKYPRMNLEFEKSFDHVIYPDNAKSYAYTKTDSRGKTEVIVKGLPFNCYSLEYRADLLKFFSDILETPETDLTESDEDTYKMRKQEICYKFAQEKQKQILEIIDNKDVKALNKYVKIVKLGKSVTKAGNLTLTGHLEQTYPNIENYNTIPFNCHEKKNFCVMPMELITEENISQVRVLDLVAFLC